MLTIREVDPVKFARALERLHTACFPEDQMPDFKLGWWWLGFARGEPVAFCGMRNVESWERTAYLKRAGVVREHRGRGYQKRLIRTRLQKARALGYQRVITDTTDNPASANSLIACGFRLYEPQSHWGFRRTLYWIRTL
jgi:RimJ/RimL family protein N-acetyltransferase